MWGGHKDGLCTDSIHVDAHSRLQVIQVDVAVLGDQIYDAMLAANLRRKNRGGQRSAVTFTSTSPDEEQGSLLTCIATGKSVWASGGKNTSTAFLANGWFPAAG